MACSRGDVIGKVLRSGTPPDPKPAHTWSRLLMAAAAMCLVFLYLHWAL